MQVVEEQEKKAFDDPQSYYQEPQPIKVNLQTKMKILEVSQLYQSKYLPFLKDIDCPQIDSIKAKLRNKKIKWCEQAHEKIYKKLLITNWQSTLYLIRVGHLQGVLSILNFYQQSKKFTPKMINKGQYGSISVFKSIDKQLVLKNIQFDAQNPQKFDSGLIELFLLKVASCLQIGPTFYNLYGYDAILFDDCLQFCMQYCSNTYSRKQIADEMQNKNLYKGLKILHSMKICHCDIKMENVAFSPLYNKFVFLDFGFASFNKEDLGYKTLVTFKGTYSYCSQEMRKSYFLKTTSFVDLYYNDLCCLIKTFQALQTKNKGMDKEIFQESIYYQFSQGRNNISGFSKMSSLQQINSIQIVSYNEQRQQAENIQEYQCLLRFFQVKFYFFSGNLQKLQAIINSQKKLLSVFKRIIFQNFLQNKRKIKYIGQDNLKYFYKKCEDIMKKQNKNYQLDIILYKYLIRVQNEGSNYLWWKRMYKMKEMCIQKDLLVQIWGDEKWMVQIFFFIDVSYDRLVEDVKRKAFFIQLYDYIYENIPLSNKYCFIRQKSKKKLRNFTLMYRHIMIVLYQYFIEKQNYTLVFLIFPYFVYFDEVNREIAQKQILKIYLKKSFFSYFVRNVEFFLSKNLGYNLDLLIGESNYKKNLIQLKKKVVQTTVKVRPNSQLQNLLRFIDLGIEFIRLVIIKSNQIYQFLKITEEIYLRLENFNCEDLQKNDIKNILYIFLAYHPCITEQKLNFLHVQKLNLNKYLSNFCNRYIDNSFEQFQKNKNCFVQSFQAIFFHKYFHFCQYQTMETHQVLQSFHATISWDIMQISCFESFFISDFLLQQIIECIRLNFISQNVLIQEVCEFKIQKITNLKELNLFLNVITKLLRVFYQVQSVKNGSQFLAFQFFYGQNQKYIHQVEQKISNLKLKMLNLSNTICDWSQKLLEAFDSRPSQWIKYQMEQQQNYFKEQIVNYILLIRSIVYFIKKQYQNAVQQISRLQNFKGFLPQILYLSLLYDVTTTKKLQLNNKIGQKIMKIYNNASQVFFIILQKNFSFFIKVILIELIKKDKKIQSMHQFIKFLEYFKQKGYKYKYFVIPIIFILRQAWNDNMNKQFYNIVNSTSIKKICQKPTLAMFFFIILIHQIHCKMQFEPKYFRRVLILCVFGFQYLPYCSFRIQKAIIKFFILKTIKTKKKLSPFNQVLYKFYNNQNIIEKTMKKLQRTRIPDTWYLKIQNNLKKVSKFSYDYYRQL